jgi:hypothetical protein
VAFSLEKATFIVAIKIACIRECSDMERPHQRLHIDGVVFRGLGQRQSRQVLATHDHAIFSLVAASALMPIAQMKPSTSRPTAVINFL